MKENGFLQHIRSPSASMNMRTQICFSCHYSESDRAAVQGEGCTADQKQASA